MFKVESFPLICSINLAHQFKFSNDFPMNLRINKFCRNEKKEKNQERERERKRETELVIIKR